MASQNIDATEQLDAREIVSLVNLATSQFASAAASFVDTGAIFEAISASAPSGSLVNRLANLGMGLCEARESDFTEQQIAYEAHIERFDSALHYSTEACNA